MTRYIKFDNDGLNAYEAPRTTIRGGRRILGYSSPSNEEMLLEDGWIRYDGDLPLSSLKMLQGVVVEETSAEEVPLPTKFTKLQIRRCLRKHGYEDELDRILSSNAELKKDWDDCLDIDLNDEMLKEAVKKGLLSQELISLIQSEYESPY